jgi:hypothetical protein
MDVFPSRPRPWTGFLNDFDLLCATVRRDVRAGHQIAYADRAHYFISGTASIDSQGNRASRQRIEAARSRTA